MTNAAAAKVFNGSLSLPIVIEKRNINTITMDRTVAGDPPASKP
jgi:hypothetical protein